MLTKDQLYGEEMHVQKTSLYGDTMYITKDQCIGTPDVPIYDVCTKCESYREKVYAQRAKMHIHNQTCTKMGRGQGAVRAEHAQQRDACIEDQYTQQVKCVHKNA